MRIELMSTNGPAVWTAFVAFMAAYVAGFDSWLLPQPGTPAAEPVALRIFIAGVTCAVLTYLAIVFEPKDRVLYRWLGDALKRANLAAFISRMQAWMVAYVATAGLAGLLIARLISAPTGDQPDQLVLLVVAALGFLTRDVGIFLAFALLPGKRRGDLAAVVMLIVLYGIAPWLAASLGLPQPNPFFYPSETPEPWLAPAVAWGEAALALVFAIFAGRSTRPQAVPSPA
jgi:hypothetical protein